MVKSISDFVIIYFLVPLTLGLVIGSMYVARDRINKQYAEIVAIKAELKTQQIEAEIYNSELLQHRQAIITLFRGWEILAKEQSDGKRVSEQIY